MCIVSQQLGSGVDGTTQVLQSNPDGTRSWVPASGVGDGSSRGVIGISIDGGGSVITTGVKGFIRVFVACTILSVTLLSTDPAVTSGSIVIDIWKDTFANYPPTNADSITGGNEPTITSDTNSEDTGLSGWSTTVNAGDVLGFNVDSVTSLKAVVLQLEVQAL
jgi:hypothetical protein